MADLADRLARALVDRYRVERELGHGGMSIVYLAEDLRDGGRVAIKLLRPEVARTLGGARFAREIEIVARLAHPSILPLKDSGEADRLLYYVTPFVAGESLRERLAREHRLAVDDALRVARDVAHGLAHAHGQGVVHRDVKPENILLPPSGPALVADFGIARAVGDATADRITQTGFTVGSPAYMSPEQAAGERDVDARSDVYSLGSVLYEMLVGEAPFSGPSARAVLARKMTQPVHPPRTSRPEIPAAVETVVLRALERAPGDRFADAADLAEAIERASRGEAIAARPRRRWWMFGRR